MIYDSEGNTAAWLIIGGMVAFYGLVYVVVRAMGCKEKHVNVRGITVWFCPVCENVYEREAWECPTPECDGYRTEAHHFLSTIALRQFILDLELHKRGRNLEKQYELVGATQRQSVQESVAELRRLQFIKYLYDTGKLSEDLTTR